MIKFKDWLKIYKNEIAVAVIAGLILFVISKVWDNFGNKDTEVIKIEFPKQKATYLNINQQPALLIEENDHSQSTEKTKKNTITIIKNIKTQASRIKTKQKPIQQKISDSINKKTKSDEQNNQSNLNNYYEPRPMTDKKFEELQ
jgi:hypothetical protein